MNYRKKRNKARLDVYTVASMLDIDVETYKEVESGLKSLSGDKIDKFCSIIDNAKGIRLENAQKEVKINEWLKSGKAIETMRGMNYNYNTLAERIDISQPTITQLFNGTRNASIGLKCVIYDFLNNPLNKYIPKPKTKKKKDKKVLEPEIEVLSLEPEEPKKEVILNDSELQNLKTENERLRKQLERYEKLIDRLV